MGLLDGVVATSPRSPTPKEAWSSAMVPIYRLAALAPSSCKASRAHIVEAGRILTGAGISTGRETGFHPLRRAG